MAVPPVSFASKLDPIKLILLDVDGVLTDGRVGMLPDGHEIKFFSIYDGLAIRLAQQAGWQIGFLSGRESGEVTARAQELGVEIVVQGSSDKVGDFGRILEKTGLSAVQVAYVGDDLPDIPLLKKVGFSAAPSNAVESVRQCVDFVTRQKGGHGAVREVVDLLLKSCGKWESVLAGLEEDGVPATG